MMVILIISFVSSGACLKPTDSPALPKVLSVVNTVVGAVSASSDFMVSASSDFTVSAASKDFLKESKMVDGAKARNVGSVYANTILKTNLLIPANQ